MAVSRSDAPRQQYGPSLPELVGPWLGRLGLLPRIGLVLAAVALAAGAVALVTHEQRVVGLLSAFDLLKLVEDHRFAMKNPPTPRKRGSGRQ